MEGHKRERGSGKYQLVVYIGRDPVTRKHRYKYKTFHGGSRAADTELAKFVVDCDKDRPSTTQSVGWLMDKYLELLAKEGRAKRTLDTYTSYIKTWVKPLIGSTELEKLTAGDIRSLAAKMTEAGKERSTVRQVHAIIRGALKFAQQNDWVDRNVATMAVPPKLEPTSVVAATPAEAALLYKEAGMAGDDLPTAIALATYTGARLGEICALRWSNIDAELGVIHFYSTKTHQTGDVPIPSTLGHRLAERARFQQARAIRIGCELTEDPYVLSFDSEADTRPAVSSYTHKFELLRDRLKLPHLHFHTLRHAYVTEALAAGVDPLTVSKLVRHRDMTMIGRVYGHGTPKGFAQAGRKVEAAFKAKAPKQLPA